MSLRLTAALAAAFAAAAVLAAMRRRSLPHDGVGRERRMRRAAAQRAEEAIRRSKWRLPREVILLRHGESLGNIRESTYRVIPDWSIPLTEQGRLEAKHAAKGIVDVIGKRKVVIYYSPYRRTQETLDALLGEGGIPDDQVSLET